MQLVGEVTLIQSINQLINKSNEIVQLVGEVTLTRLIPQGPSHSIRASGYLLLDPCIRVPLTPFVSEGTYPLLNSCLREPST